MPSTVRTFVPPHCPRSSCPSHHCATGWRWRRHGTYTRDCVPRVVDRYRCCHCGLTFSSQTFATTYYLKRPELMVPLFYRVLACSGYRQMAREMRCAHSTLVWQAARLARHCLNFLAQHGPKGETAEPLVIDGFESFAGSQYQPLHVNLVVGALSHYIRAFTHSHLRRKGSMRPEQKLHREALEATHGRPDPKAVELGMLAALQIAMPKPQAAVIRSDEHPAYVRTLRRLKDHQIRHEQTNSKEARTKDNPLFPVNAADQDLRHNGANHKRETIAFSKSHQGVVERAILTVTWRNFSKPLSANHDPRTAAMVLGLAETPLTPEAILARRIFRWKVELPEPWAGYYDRKVDTPGITNPRRLTLKRAG